MICSHAGKMEKKEVAAWKQQQHERSRRDVSIGACLLEHFANGMSASW